MKKIIYYLIVLILFSNICLSQKVTNEITLQENILKVEIKILNNTNEDILIPLNMWGPLGRVSLFSGVTLPFSYIHNIFSNHSKKLTLPFLCGEVKEIYYDELPICLQIGKNETKTINLEIDTLILFNRFQEQLHQIFEFRLSKGDIKILKELINIMKLNINDFLIHDDTVEVKLTRKGYIFECNKYNSGKKLKGIYRRLIRLPFMNYIEFYGTLEKNEE